LILKSYSVISAHINEPNSKAKLQKNSSHQDWKLARALGKLGKFSQGSRSLNWKEARESYRISLEALYSEQAFDHELIDKIQHGVEAFVGGDEHQTLNLIGHSHRIYKVTSNDQFGCSVLFDPHDSELKGRHFIAKGNDNPWFYLRRWQLLNSIGDYQTRLEGLLLPERNGWLPRFCVSQPFLPGTNPTQIEITESLLPYNFHLVSSGAYYSQEQNILLTDTYPRNVRIQNGIPALFDAIASTPEASAAEWLIKKTS